MRCVPSKWKGLVTTPTVRMPCSRAARAMTGAAPVPVPPPMPAVMNTMLAPSSCCEDLLQRLFGGGAADLGPRAGAEALGDGDAELDAAVGERLRQRLRVGVGDDELDALQVGADHVVDGVAAGAADADDGDPRLQLRRRVGRLGTLRLMDMASLRSCLG